MLSGSNGLRGWITQIAQIEFGRESGNGELNMIFKIKNIDIARSIEIDQILISTALFDTRANYMQSCTCNQGLVRHRLAPCWDQ